MANPNELNSQTGPVDPNTAFVGRASWVYGIVRSLGTSLDNRSLVDGVDDTVRTALRQMQEEGLPTDGIDIKRATTELLAQRLEGLDV